MMHKKGPDLLASQIKSYFTLLGIARGLLGIFLVISTLRLFSYSFNIIRTPYQLELREGAILSTTSLLLSGRSPFIAQTLPQYLNVYGILYNLATTPLARLFGDNFTVHRVFTAFCIFSAVVYLVVLMIRKKTSPLFAFAGGVCILANLMFSVIPLTRPDGLGFLLFVLAVLIPWQAHFSKSSLVASVLLATLAFYTKLYFYLAVIPVGLYLFLQVSKKTALLFTALCAVILTASAYLVWRVYPYYFYCTIFLGSNEVVNLLSYTVKQLREFVILYAGMLAALFVVLDWQRLAAFQLTQIPWRRWLSVFHIRQFGQPLFLFEIDYPLLALVVSTLAIAFRLGGNNGSNMVYLFQLMTPFFVIVFTRLLTQMKKQELLAILLVGLTVAANIGRLGLSVYSLKFLPDELPNNPALYQTAWNRISVLVQKNQHILNSPLLTGLLVQENKLFVDDGLNEFFGVTDAPAGFFLPPRGEPLQLDTQFRSLVLQNVQNQFYDIIIIDPKASPFVDRHTLQNYYKIVDTIDLYAIQDKETFNLEIWIPKGKIS
jgi:hypothetical protein